MSALDMSGHIDDDFETPVVATRTGFTGGGYVDGKWKDGDKDTSTHVVNRQPVSAKERQVIENGGERLVDGRKLYVNDGAAYNLAKADVWTFDDLEGKYKVAAIDNRPHRNYCKIIVGLIDDR